MRLSFKKHRVVLRIFFSYLAFLLCFLLVLILSFHRVKALLEERVVNSTRSLLEYDLKALDQRLDGFSQTAVNVMLQPSIERFMSVEPPLNDSDYANLREMSLDIQNFFLMDSFVDSMIIYFQNTESFASNTNASARSGLAYDLLLKYGDMNFAQWKEKIAAVETTAIWPVNDVSIKNKNGRYLTYIYATRLSTLRNSKASLIMLIPEARLASFFESIRTIGADQYLLMDQNANILYASGVSADLIAQSYRKDTLVQRITIEDSSKLLVSTRSPQTGLISMATIPYEVIQMDLAELTSLFSLMFGLALVVGFALLTVFTVVNVRPIKRLSHQLSIYAGKPINMDFHQMTSSLSSAITLNGDLKNRLDQQSGVLLALLKEYLYERGFHSEEDMLEKNRAVGVTFHYPNYVVLLLRIDEEFGNDNTDLVKVFHIAVLEALHTLPGIEDVCHTIHFSKIAALLGWSDDSTLEEQIANVNTLLGNIYIHGVRVHVSAGVSAPFNSPFHTKNKCAEAEQALRQVGSATGKLVLFSPVAQAKLPYAYPIEKEQRFMRLVRIGAEEEARTLFLEMFDSMLIDSRTTEDMFNQVIADLRSTFVNLLFEIADASEEAVQVHWRMLFALHAARNENDVRAEFLSVLSFICRSVADQKQHNNNDLIDRVIDYIQKNVSNENISIISVADQFHIAPAYLSRLIKAQTGNTFSDHVEGLRMAFITECLRDPNTLINDIAQKAGYSNISTFYKAFKRHFGMSPSAYRAMRRKGLL